jgi:hypothetical protein
MLCSCRNFTTAMARADKGAMTVGHAFYFGLFVRNEVNRE